jgi:hypothetical protein
MKRPVHPLPPAPAPKPPRQRPTRIDLGTYRRKGVVYEAVAVVAAHRFATLAQKAMENHDGRAEAAGGGIVVLVRRVEPPRPPAEGGS